MLSSTKQHITSLIQARYFVPLFILLLTLFSILVAPGYESFVGDQTVYLPPLYSVLDSSLFQNDMEFFKLIHSERTILSDFLAFFVRRGIDVLPLLFSLSIIFRILLFSSLYILVKYLTNNKSYALFALLFFITPLTAPGIGHGTIESAFSYRSITLPAGLLFLVLYIYGWRLTSLLPLFFGFAIHPITALPFFFFLFLDSARLLWKSRQRLSSAITSALPSILALGFVLIILITRASGAVENFFEVISPEWKQLAMFTNGRAFFAFWNTEGYLSLVLWILLGGIPLLYLRRLIPDQSKRMAIILLFVTPLIMLAVAIIGEITLFHGIVKFHFQRGLLLLIIMSAIMLGFHTLHNANKSRETLENGFLFSIILWFLYKENFVFLREAFLIFVPPLAILYYGRLLPVLKTNRTIRNTFAIMIFLIGYSLIVWRTTIHQDIKSLIIFHFILFGGFVLSLLFAKSSIRPQNIVQFTIVLALPFFALTSLAGSRSFTIYPYFSYNAEYVEACDWVQQNTGPESVFIVEPFAFVGEEPNEFRLACFRPIFTTLKDGGIAPYGKEEAFEWQIKYDLAYKLKDDLDILETIKRDHKVDFLFSEKNLSTLNRPLVFENDQYFIYDIR
jgi:hypothetical protein